MTTSVNRPSNTSLIALYNFNQSTASLSASVERLSSGLRINRAADDAAGLTIADNLNQQALSMGQAARNANDGISIMQIADSTLEEAIDIMGSVKTKTVQAAQDGQTDASRKIIQSDINTLLAELDLISSQAVYNDHPLLTGSFSNKRFQVGAYTGEELRVSIDSSQSSKIGHLSQATLAITNDTGGSVHLQFSNTKTGQDLTMQSVAVEYDNDTSKSMQAVAEQINNYTAETGISAQAQVESTSSKAVQAGATSSTFAINGETIGAVTTLAGDSNNALTSAINNKSSSTGIIASINSEGLLTLSSDGRPIEATGLGSALDATDANNMSTFGTIQIFQMGSYQLAMTDLSSGLAVSFTSNMDFSGTMTTTIDSNLTSGSVLGGSSTLAAGFTLGSTFTGAQMAGAITTTSDSTLKATTVLATGSLIAQDSIMGGDAENNANITTTSSTLMAAGSTLISGSTIAAGTYLTNDIETGSGTVAAGTTLSAATVTTTDTNISNTMLLQSSSILVTGSTFAATSYVGGDLTLNSAMILSQDMTLESSSTIADVDGVTSLASDSTIGGPATLAAVDISLISTMTVKSGSVLSATTELATGSTIGGDATLNGAHTTNADLSLAASSVLASGSVITQGTELTNDLVTTLGTISAGTTLEQDYTTAGNNTMTFVQTVKSDSVLASDSLLAANSGGSASTELTNESMVRLSDMSVLTQENAQTAMRIADAALEDLNRIRAGVGANQNQFSSSINNLTMTKTNLESAVSRIMDVDLAEESSIFARMSILVQSGAFAVAQANAIPSTILPILQGGNT